MIGSNMAVVKVTLWFINGLIRLGDDGYSSLAELLGSVAKLSIVFLTPNLTEAYVLYVIMKIIIYINALFI